MTFIAEGKKLTDNFRAAMRRLVAADERFRTIFLAGKISKSADSIEWVFALRGLASTAAALANHYARELPDDFAAHDFGHTEDT